MRRQKFHFINKDLKDKLRNAAELFIHVEQSPKEFMDLLKTLLPIQKSESGTWKTRVEGFYYISELLFRFVLDLGRICYGENWNRTKIIQQANLRPFSHYHWKTGSREPIANVLTRDDYLNDPSTALVKLEDDIISLTGILRKQQEERKKNKPLQNNKKIPEGNPWKKTVDSKNKKEQGVVNGQNDTVEYDDEEETSEVKINKDDNDI